MKFAVTARDPLADPRVAGWRAAERITLALLLGYASLQYYFFDVYLTIMALPRVTLPGVLS